jgi:hypothetical protein
MLIAFVILANLRCGYKFAKTGEQFATKSDAKPYYGAAAPSGAKNAPNGASPSLAREFPAYALSLRPASCPSVPFAFGTFANFSPISALFLI